MASPTTEAARRAVWDTLKTFLCEQEDERRRLLGLWVSELEPCFMYTRDGMQLIGITVKGWQRPVIYAKGWTRAAQQAQDFWMGEMLRAPSTTSGELYTGYLAAPRGNPLGVVTDFRIASRRFDSSIIRRGFDIDWSRVDIKREPK